MFYFNSNIINFWSKSFDNNQDDLEFFQSLKTKFSKADKIIADYSIGIFSFSMKEKYFTRPRKFFLDHPTYQKKNLVPHLVNNGLNKNQAEDFWRNLKSDINDFLTKPDFKKNEYLYDDAPEKVNYGLGVLKDLKYDTKKEIYSVTAPIIGLNASTMPCPNKFDIIIFNKTSSTIESWINKLNLCFDLMFNKVNKEEFIDYILPFVDSFSYLPDLANLLLDSSDLVEPNVDEILTSINLKNYHYYKTDYRNKLERKRKAPTSHFQYEYCKSYSVEQWQEVKLYAKLIEDFFLFHELGHINLGHTNYIRQSYKKNEPIGKELIYKFEFEADEYAANILLKGWQLGEYIQSVLIKLFLLLHFNEFDLTPYVITQFRDTHPSPIARLKNLWKKLNISIQFPESIFKEIEVNVNFARNLGEQKINIPINK